VETLESSLRCQVMFVVKKNDIYIAEKRGVEIALKISRYLGLERDSWRGNYVCCKLDKGNTARRLRMKLFVLASRASPETQKSVTSPPPPSRLNFSFS
jgi:hypothetical protein